ncbi:thaumatin family-domain-containing protein [Lactifluus volemus]|nr:thaumatin family-domain-containing protein [Lactifluus volemus]
MNLYLSLLSLAFLPAGATARLFTVVNACPFTIWHIYTAAGNGTAPIFPTGWESPTLTSTQFAVPDNWTSGRIWGRRACNFGGGNLGQNTAPGACLDGGCNGGIQCNTVNGTGQGPVTVAEWTLQGNGNLDYYDVTLVNGFNLPMAIIPSAANCQVASCPIDLNPQCPAQLIGPRDPTGLIVGCQSACEAGVDNPADSANCCTGTHNTQATCPANGVSYYNYFKGNCPNSYVYAFDGASGTALWTCPSAQASDYKLTFCPCVYFSLSSLFFLLVDIWHVMRTQTSARLPSPCDYLSGPSFRYPVWLDHRIKLVVAFIFFILVSLIQHNGHVAPAGTATSRTTTASASSSSSKGGTGKSDARSTLALVGTTGIWAFFIPGAVAAWLLIR